MFVMTTVATIIRGDRQDFKDVRNARNEDKQGRKELRGDYHEARETSELGRYPDGVSKEEIYRDRQEIRADVKEIRNAEENRSKTRPTGISSPQA